MTERKVTHLAVLQTTQGLQTACHALVPAGQATSTATYVSCSACLVTETYRTARKGKRR